jgi:AcrR family transcriptional regulator
MARPRSGDKRNAILNAATRVFAERGLADAPTSEISKRAGVAEGTLFTYFKTKDDLINSLYREIKLEVADVMMSDFPRKKTVRIRLQHVWDSYVKWGVTNPKQRKVLAQLQASDLLSKEAREAGSAPFVEIQTMTREAMQQRILQDDLAVELVSKTLGAMAEATMDLMRLHRSKANEYRDRGFEMFWASITRR